MPACPTKLPARATQHPESDTRGEVGERRERARTSVDPIRRVAASPILARCYSCLTMSKLVRCSAQDARQRRARISVQSVRSI
jgi:hypothetical protein